MIVSGAHDGAAGPAIRTANRLSDNEGQLVVLDGLAVDVAGRACIQLDRSDAIVPVAGRARWDAALRDHPVRARGRLVRHAAANDPVTGLASLALEEASVAPITFPADGRVRTAVELRAADGRAVEIEGMAFRSGAGSIVVLYGGIVYVRDLADWDAAVVSRTVVVSGTVRNGPPLPVVPRAGGMWHLAGARLVAVAPPGSDDGG